LVKNLFRRVDPNSYVAAQLVSTQLDADDTLRLIAAAFGLKHEDPSKAVLLKRLEEYLLSVYKQGRRALLVIDEAQNLTPRAVEELRMLSNFQSGEKSLLQSFLLGQPEFRYTLQGEGMQQLRQRIIASYHLGPMDSDETRSYIEHRMKTVGWAGDPEFGEDCFAPIFQYTGGIPRRINTLCDRVLLFGYLEDRHRIDAETVQAVIGDLNGEMPTLAANEASGPRATARKAASGDDRMLEQLDRRVSKMERSIVNILKLSRELLNLAQQQKQPEKHEGH
jgi:type II secretory pathway predicted ATPase ExeA